MQMIPSLCLHCRLGGIYEVFDRRGTDVSSEYAARVLKQRPYLRFDGDGKRVDPVEMGLIDEYPDKGDTRYM